MPIMTAVSPAQSNATRDTPGRTSDAKPPTTIAIASHASPESVSARNSTPPMAANSAPPPRESG